ncbi:DNA damage-regulated autophagy modulator protein 2 [Triplophysa tibetana]|uniref:DNA damage-regulated autophagy modulator protein 2 n=1 Tax=Triplophysa tibetana TaxID=1572043 RepID=A0A5A9NP13_9TELE|nr:DNA damage-regulated autophagy modulator protein 2 [Triplophysa tibetana]
MWWFQEGLCALPAALVVWTAATFVFAYITAVILKHVDPLVPYISDTGTVAPERCVFGIMLNVSAFLGVATMYVRYKQVQALIDAGGTRLHLLNRVGLVLGCGSSLGMCVVANFQKTTLFSMHLVGAVLTFGVGALYVFAQTLLSYRMQPHIHMFVSSVIMYSMLPGVEVNKKLHWTPGEPLLLHIHKRLQGKTSHARTHTLDEHVCDTCLFVQKINLRAEAELHGNHLYHSPHYRGVLETSPLLAGST